MNSYLIAALKAAPWCSRCGKRHYSPGSCKKKGGRRA